LPKPKIEDIDLFRVDMSARQ